MIIENVIVAIPSFQHWWLDRKFQGNFLVFRLGVNHTVYNTLTKKWISSEIQAWVYQSLILVLILLPRAKEWVYHFPRKTKRNLVDSKMSCRRFQWYLGNTFLALFPLTTQFLELKFLPPVKWSSMTFWPMNSKKKWCMKGCYWWKIV